MPSDYLIFSVFVLYSAVYYLIINKCRSVVRY